MSKKNTDCIVYVKKKGFELVETKEYTQLENILEQELDRRYEFYLNNPTVGKSWEEVKANL